MKVKIGFTGTRDDLTDFQKVSLKNYIANIKDPIESAHHGDCVGADTVFHNACVELGIKVVIHPPVVSALRAFNNAEEILPEKTYFERNRDIVDTCDLLIACPKTDFETKGGTWYTINYALKKKVPVVKICPESVWIDVDHLIE